ncbi:hypothetical protein SpCBS45565_g02309 [Spizellomyces sp. 'palustris']|nr:hypothetical protein SpCBS45565_g02309 [Spizellomyces sp. 'palustris']
MSRRMRTVLLLLFICTFIFLLSSLRSPATDDATSLEPSIPAASKLQPRVPDQIPLQESSEAAPVPPIDVMTPYVDPDTERKNAFVSIFETNGWGNPESRSGPGSTVGNTARIRNFINTVIDHFSIQTFLDAPCGDCNWQPGIPSFSKVAYTGADIVPNVIIQNMRKYLYKPNMRFVNLDLAMDPFPQDAFDAILCRDAIQHLPLKDGMKIYNNFQTSGAKYLITNFHDPRKGNFQNTNVKPGDFYHNNPLLPPFNFSLPLFYTIDASDEHLVQNMWERKYVAVWRLPAIGLGNGTAFVPDEEAAKKGIVPVSDEGRSILEELGLLRPA